MPGAQHGEHPCLLILRAVRRGERQLPQPVGAVAAAAQDVAVREKAFVAKKARHAFALQSYEEAIKEIRPHLSMLHLSRHDNDYCKLSA